MNAVLYRPRGGCWAMTERGRNALSRTAERLVIGPSRMQWDGAELAIEVDEIAVPLPRRMRGRILLRPQALAGEAIAIDPAGRHHWRPIAPQAAVSVAFERPSLAWTGTAYIDSNFGSVPLEQDFQSWNWSRRHDANGTTVFYDIATREGAARSLAFHFDAMGRRRDTEPAQAFDLPRGLWGVTRRVRAPGSDVRLLRTLEDAPFYTRSLVHAQAADGIETTVHESLSLDRFARRWVQVLLPFRMPRRG